jgi:hypothetical protein
MHAYGRHVYWMAFVRSTPMRDAPMRWPPMRDTPMRWLRRVRLASPVANFVRLAFKDIRKLAATGLTMTGLSTKPASSYEEDHVVGTTHVGAVLQKITCLVAAFQSDDSIYICLKSS